MGRIADILTNVILDDGGNYSFTYEKTTKFSDGTDMNDSKVVAPMYVKVGTEYFKMKHPGAINVEWFGVVGDGVTNDLEKMQQAFDFAARSYRHIYVPPGKYFCGYETPLVMKGDGLIVEGAGSPTNADSDFGSIIYGRVEIGTTTTDTTRGQLVNIGFRGPGWQDQVARTTQDKIGILLIKALELSLYNVSVEGFKYGMTPYEDPTISILQVNTITVDHCRFYNNKICGVEMGRGGHAFTITNGTNISLSDHPIVIGVIDKTTDSIVWGNSEPVLSVTINDGNTIQGWYKTGIVVTSSKKVSIENNYFEQGNTFADANEAILLGSNVASSLVYLGMEDNVMAPSVSGNWFFLNTLVNTYKANTCCIRVKNVKKGCIANNHLSNIRYPANDPQLQSIYLIKNDEATLDEDIQYHGNMVTNGRLKTEEYVIEDAGYSAFHDTHMFTFVGDRPPFLADSGNRFKYNGTFYSLSYLGGGSDANSAGAKFGAVSTDTVKFPQVLNNLTTIIA